MAPLCTIPHCQCKSSAKTSADRQPLVHCSRRNAGTSFGVKSLPSPGSSVTFHSDSDSEQSANIGDARKDMHHMAVVKITEFFEQELKTARKEILKLKHENRKAEDSRSKVHTKLVALHSTITNFNAIRDAATQCSVCSLPMNRPFVLPGCGHMFCHGCLRSWFHACLARQMQYCSIPVHLKHPPPYTAADITEIFEQKHLYVPLYDCPMCRAPVRERPLDIFPLREIIQATYLSFGHPEEVAAEVVHADVEDIWADVFYRQN